jgi:hypothetical protein
MDAWVMRMLRTVIVIAWAGSAGLQVAVTLGVVLNDDRTARGVVAAVLVVLGIATLQITGIAIWRLLTMVRRGTVFSPDAFRYVDLVIAAIGTGAVLVLALAVDARFANHATPGDQVAPGVVALICGLALLAAGVAMVIYVLRVLLAQAVTLNARARDLQSQLDEVI